MNPASSISVVTPTFCRPIEVEGLLENLRKQTLLPMEVILIDGAPSVEKATDRVVSRICHDQPFQCRYIRHGRGTAIQRNAGIEIAQGSLIAFVDDDVRLDPTFFEKIMGAFEADTDGEVGGIVGYRTNCHFDPGNRSRWKWYRRLKLLTTYEPGRYDFQSGYPINVNMQPPFSGVRKVDFMTTACAVWRRRVFDSGLRFDHFFSDYGVLEDAHLSLKAGRTWKLLQCGDAHCQELNSPTARVSSRQVGYKSVVNYYYVFRDIAGPLTWRHQLRFWRFQVFELLRISASAIWRHRRSDLEEFSGRLKGFITILGGLGPAS
jgi:GT2 family glycosyltransferase